METINLIHGYFEAPEVVLHYSRATENLGLWESEKILLGRYFHPRDSILDLGCGTGRIAFGLESLGFRHLMGVDYSKGMVKDARILAAQKESGISFRKGDATRLSFLEGDLFEGVIFGFNGLMQIPGTDRRIAAMREVYRILAPGGIFIFTAHDRDSTDFQDFRDMLLRPPKSENLEPGDVIADTDLGRMYIHIPSQAEVRDQLEGVGFTILESILRRQLAAENRETREFADETRFWVAKKA